MGGATLHANFFETEANGDAALVDNHEVIILRDALDGNDLSGLFGHVERLDTLSAAVCHTIVFDGGSFAVAVLADDKHGFAFRVVHANHADHFILSVFVDAEAANAGGGATHGTHSVLVEADGATVAVGDDNLVFTVGQHNAHDSVVFADVDGVHTVGAWTGVVFETGFLDDTLFCAEGDVVRAAEVCVVELLDVEAGVDGVIRVDVEHVLDGASFGVLGTFGNLIDLQPEAASFGGEEQHGVVHRGGIDTFDEVGIAGASALGAYAAARLRTEVGERSAFDVSQMRKRDDHLVIGIEVFRVEFVA